MVIESAIPDDLKFVDQWVLWRYEARGSGKPTKVPCQPNGKNASSTNAATWCDYQTAIGSYHEGGFDGIGFVVSEQDDFVGVDIDHCLDPETGTLDDHAVGVIRKCNSYTEISPSGRGIRIICRAHTLIPSAKSERIEIYPNRRFLTITGRVLGDHKPIRHADDGLMFALRYAAAKKVNGNKPGSAPDPTVALIESAGLYRRQVEPGVHEILCPWSDTHTGGDPSGTKYLEANFNGYSHATFHCHHAHCANRTTTDFLRAIGANTCNAEEDASSNPFFWVGAEIFARAPIHSWAIEGYLTDGTVSLLYGKKDTYKSFVAISMGMAVASGLDWYGHQTVSGGFAYLCGEGRAGIAGRMEAWCVRHKLDPKRLPLFLGKQRMKLDDAGEVQKIADSLVETIDTLKWPSLRVLIIDTLSSSTPGLDENDAGAMSLAVDNVKTLICDRIGCAALIVHHAGKDMDRGARGSSALEANSEAVFTSARSDHGMIERVVVECKHIKDSEKPEPLTLERHLVNLDDSRVNLIFDRVGKSAQEREAFVSEKPAQKDRVLQLLRDGMSLRDIEVRLAEEGMRVGKSTIARWRTFFTDAGMLMEGL